MQVAFFVSCASTSNFSAVDNQLAQDNISDAIEYLEKTKKKYYSFPRDTLLYKIDLAILYHYAQDFDKSNELFTEAENLLFKLYGKSFFQEIGSFFVNDNVRDYAGEDYEDIYINIFKAINFLNQNDIEAGSVEIRRVNNKIKGLNVKYQKAFEKSRSEIEKNGGQAPPFELTEFTNSALANYLSILMYRSENDLSNAEVSLRQLEAVYREQKNIYAGLKIPTSIAEDFSVPRNKARLNFVAFTGMSPKKKEFSFPFFFLDSVYKIALPQMKLRGSKVASIEIRVNDNVLQMEKIESIENIALDTFRMQLSVIRARAVARTIVRVIATTTLDESASETENKTTSQGLLLGSFAAQLINFAIERADVRSANFFPAFAYIQGITLEEGIYDVDFLFKNENNQVLHKKSFKELDLRVGKLNLIEAFYIK
ncbi:MAG: hypothetical protein ACRC4W_05845 [Treponemataceae bacterium]